MLRTLARQLFLQLIDQLRKVDLLYKGPVECIAGSASASSPTMSLTLVVRLKSNSRRPLFTPGGFFPTLEALTEK
jgi:hypothetical protein